MSNPEARVEMIASVFAEVDSQGVEENYRRARLFADRLSSMFQPSALPGTAERDDLTALLSNADPRVAGWCEKIADALLSEGWHRASPDRAPGTAEFETLLDAYGDAEMDVGGGITKARENRADAARQAVLDAFHRGQPGLREGAVQAEIRARHTLRAHYRSAVVTSLLSRAAIGTMGLAEADRELDMAAEAVRALSAPQQEGDKT